MQLPARHKRPPKTNALLALEQAISEINDFFWLSIAGYHVLRTLRPSDCIMTKDFLPSDISSHIDVEVSKLDHAISQQEGRLIRLGIVDAVTFYEGYLKAILQKALMKIGPDMTKKPKLQIDLSTISPTQSSETFIKNIWANQRTSELLSENYQNRPKRIDTALGMNIVNGDSEHNTDFKYVELAGELRNCIVHSGGLVDKRTYNTCSAIITGIELDQQLLITKDILFCCLHNMLNHARDIDLFVRIKYKVN